MCTMFRDIQLIGFVVLVLLDENGDLKFGLILIGFQDHTVHV